MVIDDKAKTLLRQLPYEKQVDIASCLQSKVQNAGPATRSTTPLMPQAVPLVMMVLDEKAKTLLQQLPYEKQVDLASFLQQKMGEGGIRNPSAWMAKSCLAAGANT